LGGFGFGILRTVIGLLLLAVVVGRVVGGAVVAGAVEGVDAGGQLFASGAAIAGRHGIPRGVVVGFVIPPP
jgi:hypothetical protein